MDRSPPAATDNGQVERVAGGRPRHRGTRGVQFLVVAKLPKESEAFAWFVAAVWLRAWDDAAVREDIASLAKVAGISPRSARWCREKAMESGLLKMEQGVLIVDGAALERRREALRVAGCCSVKIRANLLRDPDLQPVDRRILAWIQWKGRGVDRNGGVFVLSQMAAAHELGIDRRTLNRRLQALGTCVERSWRRCADGWARSTYWVHARGQNVPSSRPECPIVHTPDAQPECPTIENHPSPGPRPECPTTCEPELRTYLSTGAAPGTGSAEEAHPAEVETREPVPRPRTLEDVRQVVERWRLEQLDQERLKPGWTAVLLERLGVNRPPDLEKGPRKRRQARERGLRADLIKLAKRICAWAGSPDKLGMWLIRVAREYGPTNLPAYLRRSSEHGDPGTVLRSAKRNQIGRGAEVWRDYSPKTERALQGPHADDVERLVAGGALLLGEDREDGRTELRLQLRRLLALGNRRGARAVLLRLVPEQANDPELARALDGIIPVAEARQLLGAA